MVSRWDRLFDDLEAQLEQQESLVLGSEVADRTRGEVAQLRLVDRLPSVEGRRIAIRVLGAHDVVRGIVRSAGPEWVLLSEEPRTEALVPLTSVVAIRELSRQVVAQTDRGAVAERLRLGYVLRGIARDRSEVVVTLVDGSAVRGTIDRVGADFLELAEHQPDQPRRASMVAGVCAVPLTALAVLRRSG